jgi:hypothetical protein
MRRWWPAAAGIPPKPEPYPITLSYTPSPGEIADMAANALEIAKLQLFHGPVPRRPELPG